MTNDDDDKYDGDGGDDDDEWIMGDEYGREKGFETLVFIREIDSCREFYSRHTVPYQHMVSKR